MLLTTSLRRRRRPATRRRAFTLLEVILALVILGGALAVLGEVMQLANRGAQDARAETQAQLLANSLMDEVLAGVDGATEATRQRLDVDDATPWLYTIRTGTSDIEGVYPVEVIVEQDLEPQFNPVKFRLVRWMPSVAETDERAEDAASQGGAGGQSGGQGGGAGNGGGAGGAGSSGGMRP